MEYLLLSLCFALPAGAAPPRPADGLSPLDVARLRSVLEARISPDGRWIAYAVEVPRDPLAGDDGPPWSELHVVDVEGRSRPFVSGKVNASRIEWTPDGRGISFLARRHDEAHAVLYVIPIDGGEARPRVRLKTAISSYAWSPDGRRVALLAPEEEDPEKKRLREKGFSAEPYEEGLGPVRIWIADAAPNRSADDVAPRMLPLDGSVSEIRWSPDGTRLAAAIAPTPRVDDHYMYRRIRIVDAERGEVIRRIENPGKLGAIAWSPGGTRLAFASGEDIHDPFEGRLLLADAEGEALRRAIPAYLPDILEIVWKDDRSLLLLAADGCRSSVVELDLASEEIRTHLGPPGPIFRALSADREARRLALIGDAPSHPAEVFLAELGGSSRRLTDVNPWLGERRLAPQEVVRYAARDGEMIEGVLVRPLDERPGARHPLILVVHGGPEAHVSDGWVTRYHSPGQVAAARGFAVFHPNYRGSTGRGAAFAKAHQGDYGGKEFDDLIDGIDHLVGIGLVDRDRVGVTGGSYGGFAAAWCATRHSERFAASVMFVGISDHISKAGTTDIPDEIYLVHGRKRVWEDWRFFLERSPIYHVQKARTPILILHGKEDTRVPPSQSLELYRHLKVLQRAPVRLILYPGEGHGNRRAAARYDFSLRQLRWMEHYLRGPGGDPPPVAIDYGFERKAGGDGER